MTVTPDIRKRLLYAKYLLARAKKSQTEVNELAVAASLLLMHDASELLMIAASDHLRLSKWDNFMQFWEKVKLDGYKEPGHKNRMSELNSLRVSLKHRGTLPHAQTVRDLMPRVEAFCEEVTKDLLDLDFAELSLADLVSTDEVRRTLQEAQNAFAGGDKNDAFVKVRIAFDILIRSLVGESELIRVPRRLTLHHKELPSHVEAWAKEFQDASLESIRVVNILMLGIDPVKYRFFLRNTPHVSWTVSGKTYTNLAHDFNRKPDELFHSCFEFVVDIALNASR